MQSTEMSGTYSYNNENCIEYDIKEQNFSVRIDFIDRSVARLYFVQKPTGKETEIGNRQGIDIPGDIMLWNMTSDPASQTRSFSNAYFIASQACYILRLRGVEILRLTPQNGQIVTGKTDGVRTYNKDGNLIPK